MMLGDDVFTANLTILNVTRDDVGVYVCSISFLHENNSTDLKNIVRVEVAGENIVD